MISLSKGIGFAKGGLRSAKGVVLTFGSRFPKNFQKIFDFSANIV
jgi:hypothetical protein